MGAVTAGGEALGVVTAGGGAMGPVTEGGRALGAITAGGGALVAVTAGGWAVGAIAAGPALWDKILCATTTTGFDTYGECKLEMHFCLVETVFIYTEEL